jgi:hypothetical protein
MVAGSVRHRATVDHHAPTGLRYRTEVPRLILIDGIPGSGQHSDAATSNSPEH